MSKLFSQQKSKEVNNSSYGEQGEEAIVTIGRAFN
jgi:hypothetical protein